MWITNVSAGSDSRIFTENNEELKQAVDVVIMEDQGVTSIDQANFDITRGVNSFIRTWNHKEFADQYIKIVTTFYPDTVCTVTSI
jgi:hypothetical protein